MRPTLGMAVARLAAVSVVVSILALAFGRFGPPPPERAAAMRVLAEPIPPVAGRDGSDAWWVLGRAVPRAERAQAAAAHRAWLDARQDLEEAKRFDEAKRLADPLARYAAHPKDLDDPRTCNASEDGCLAKVRADPAGTQALLAERAAQVEAARELVGFDGIRLGPVARGYLKMPTLSSGRSLLYTALAARFVRGEQDAAMADTCRDLVGWRRLGADTDSLVANAVATFHVRDDARLLGEMILERAPDAPLPAECTPALAPPTDAELSACRTMKTEYRWLRHDLAHFGPDDAAGDEHAFGFDPAQAAGVVAPRFAHYCGDTALATARADKAAHSTPAPDAGCGPLEFLTHFNGCAVARLHTTRASEYERYADLRTDQAASIALVRTLLWLRTRSPDPADWPALLPQRPASLGLIRKVGLDGKKGRLWVRLRDTKQWKRFWITVQPPRPEAGSRHQPIPERRAPH